MIKDIIASHAGGEEQGEAVARLQGGYGTESSGASWYFERIMMTLQNCSVAHHHSVQDGRRPQIQCKVHGLSLV